MTNKDKSKKVDTFRVNMHMSTEIVNFYQEMADAMGIPRSNAMIIGLKTYMDQQAIVEMSKEMKRHSFDYGSIYNI